MYTLSTMRASGLFSWVPCHRVMSLMGGLLLVAAVGCSPTDTTALVNEAKKTAHLNLVQIDKDVSAGTGEPFSHDRNVTSVTGRLGIQFIDQPLLPVHLGFSLQGNRTNGHLFLETPLGTTLAAVYWSPDQAWVVKGDTKQVFGSIDALLRQELGSELPLEGLFDWINGKNSDALNWSQWLIQDNQPQRRLSVITQAPAPAVRMTILLDLPS